MINSRPLYNKCEITFSTVLLIYIPLCYNAQKLIRGYFMRLWDIVKSVGSVAIQTALPGTGSLIVGAVNQLLPGDKKLPSTATGDDLSNAINTLPPEQQSQVLMKEYDVTIEDIKQSHSTIRAMLESDAKAPHTTRPYIAKGAFHIVAFVTLVMVCTWATGVFSGNDKMVKTVTDGWPWVIAVIGPLVTLLYSYFGVLRKESENKMNAANGLHAGTGIGALLSKVLGGSK